MYENLRPTELSHQIPVTLFQQVVSFHFCDINDFHKKMMKDNQTLILASII